MPAAGRYDEDVAHDFDTDSDGNSDEWEVSGANTKGRMQAAVEGRMHQCSTITGWKVSSRIAHQTTQHQPNILAHAQPQTYNFCVI